MSEPQHHEQPQPQPTGQALHATHPPHATRPPQSAQTRPPLAHRLRRAVVIAIVASFGAAAVAGIAVLLGGVQSDAAGKVLATTSLTGVLSVAVLCGAALLGKRAQAFGWVTIAVSLATLVRALWLIWGDPDWSGHSFELTLTMAIVTAACAVASLLLLLVAHERRAVRMLLFATLAMLAFGVLLTLFLVWDLGPDYDAPGRDAFYERFWQLTGIVWILAALGIVVVPVMSLLLRAGRQPQATAVAVPTAAAPGSAPAPTVQLSPASQQKLAQAALAAGVTPDELVERLLG